MNDCYLYRHIRPDKNEVFYIGIGSIGYRAFDKNHRNKYWQNIVDLNNGLYEIEIMMNDLTWEQACSKESEFILLYGRKDLNTGTLCNMTSGGEGAYGRIVSNETKKKISTSVSINHHMLGKSHTIEAKQKISESGYKKVQNTVTGEIFDSVKCVSVIIGMRPNTLSRKLSGIRKNNTIYKYL